MPNPPFSDLCDLSELAKLFQIERRADLGDLGIDPTSELLIAESEKFSGVFRARQPGVIAGLSAIPTLLQVYDENVEFEEVLAEGSPVEAGQIFARISGNKRSILAIERPALDLLCHLSGIATATQAYVRLVDGTSAKICATRKTNIGLRQLEKWAVICGGGDPHRIGLYDGVLIKDNHLEDIPSDQLSARVTELVQTAKDRFPNLSFVQCEVDSFAQFEKVIGTGVDMILLDNRLGQTDNSALISAVRLRNELNSSVLLEASGGINENTVRPIAETGVDRISVGAITHSAQVLDIRLDDT